MEFYCLSDFRTQHKSNRQASNIDDKIDPKKFMETTVSQFIKDHSQASLEAYNNLISKEYVRRAGKNDSSSKSLH